MFIAQMPNFSNSKNQQIPTLHLWLCHNQILVSMEFNFKDGLCFVIIGMASGELVKGGEPKDCQSLFP